MGILPDNRKVRLTPMSNSNMSTALARLFERGETYAFAFARGKEAFADMALDLFQTTVGDDQVGDDIAKVLYTSVRNRAETIAYTAGKPLKEQTPKSAASQVAKLGNFYTLGVLASETNASISEAVDYAKSVTLGKYTPLVACAVAVKTLFAKTVKTERPNVTLDAMVEAIDAALVPADEPTASEAVAKIAKQWEKLTEGTDKVPPPYPDAFSALAQAEPSDPVQRVAVLLAEIEATLKRLEDSLVI